jgi:hypothetical protein
MREHEVYQRSFITLRRMREFHRRLRELLEATGPHFKVDVDTCRQRPREYAQLCAEYDSMCEMLAERQRNTFGAIMVKYPGMELNWSNLRRGDDPHMADLMERIHHRMSHEDYEREINRKWTWHAQRIELMLRGPLTPASLITFKMTL